MIYQKRSNNVYIVMTKKKSTYQRSGTYAVSGTDINNYKRIKVLAWWSKGCEHVYCFSLHSHQNHSGHQYVYQVNDTVIALAVTQVTVERTFSGLNYILNDLRFRMKEDIVDDIMVLRTNV